MKVQRWRQAGQDRNECGCSPRGPITRTLQSTFFDAVKGRDRKYESWLTTV